VSTCAGGELRVVIVHERFTEMGGSERVVGQFRRIWPRAEVYVSVLDPRAFPADLVADVRTTGLQRLYRGGQRYAHLLPLLPAAMAQLDLGHPDVVVTSHHAFSNRVRPPVGVPVVAYVHTPARWMWEPAMVSHEGGGRLGRAALSAFARSQRPADRAAAGRTALVVANSNHVARRIRRCWGLDATVLHPPIDTAFFTPPAEDRREDFFLLAGRLVPYKRPELAVAAARRAGLRLVVAGGGRSLPAVRAMAGPGTEVLGPVSDETLRDLYRRCRALIFPGEEDFGMVPVEAQACGSPVVACAAGGALESVVDGTTGALYRHDGVDALTDALSSFDPDRFDQTVIRTHAERFAPERFRLHFESLVRSAL
jgi:glycosyltransferase involved in cell wall biosynthesis